MNTITKLSRYGLKTQFVRSMKAAVRLLDQMALPQTHSDRIWFRMQF